jgi:hypothetical protein
VTVANLSGTYIEPSGDETQLQADPTNPDVIFGNHQTVHGLGWEDIIDNIVLSSTGDPNGINHPDAIAPGATVNFTFDITNNSSDATLTIWAVGAATPFLTYNNVGSSVTGTFQMPLSGRDVVFKVSGIPEFGVQFDYTLDFDSAGGGGGGGGGSGPPDYTATDTFVSTTSTMAGENIRVDYRWQNLGGKGDDVQSIGIYLSTDADVTTFDTLLTKDDISGSRASLQDRMGRTSIALNEKVTLPANLAPGTYYIGVIVDSKNNIPNESNETNNVSAPVAITITGNNTFNGHSYSFVSFNGTTHTYSEAAAEAAAMGGYLSTITSQAENDFIHNNLSGGLINNLSAAFIGATDAGHEGEWQWISGPDAGTTFWDNGAVGGQYSNWRSGEPSNATNNPEGSENYAVMEADGTWNDVPSSRSAANTVGMIVEFSQAGGTGVPDLTSSITNLSISTVTAGNTVTVDYRISSANTSSGAGNIGFFLSTDSTIDATEDRLLVYANAFNAVPADGFLDLSSIVTLPDNLAAGTYYIGVIADYDDTVAETGGNNNASAGVPITVLGGTGSPTDFSGDSSTLGQIVSGVFTGSISTAGDHDWYRVQLEGNVHYVIKLEGSATNSGTLSDPFLTLYSGTSNLIASDDDSGVGFNSELQFTSLTTRNYYIDAGAIGDATGSYTVRVVATIDGTANADLLPGTSMDDLIFGGLGKDIMDGFDGSDIFDFNSKSETLKGANRDVIFDFDGVKDAGDDLDRIDLSGIDAKKGAGNQAFKYIGAHKFHHKAGELQVKYNAVADIAIVSGDINGDGRADFQIEVHSAAALAKADFIL